jgi:hypothetical protein
MGGDAKRSRQNWYPNQTRVTKNIITIALPNIFEAHRVHHCLNTLIFLSKELLKYFFTLNTSFFKSYLQTYPLGKFLF